MPISCPLCTLPIVRPVAVNKCPACGDDVHSECLNQYIRQKHARAFDVWTQGLDATPCLRNQQKNPTIASWPPNSCDCCAESIGESAVRSYMRQEKEPNVPKRKTNRSMTKTSIVNHVTSKNDVTENKRAPYSRRWRTLHCGRSRRTERPQFLTWCD